MKTCPECHQRRMKTGPQEFTRRLFGRTYAATLPGTKCGNCGGALVSMRDLRRFERAIAADVAAHGPVTGESLSWMRLAALDLTGEELARLLRVRASTLSGWETGKRDVDPNAWFTTSSLVLDEVAGRHSTRDRLKAVATQRRARRITLKVGRRGA